MHTQRKQHLRYMVARLSFINVETVLNRQRKRMLEHRSLCWGRMSLC